MALVALLVPEPAAGDAPVPAGGDGLARVRAAGVLRWGGDLPETRAFLAREEHA